MSFQKKKSIMWNCKQFITKQEKEVYLLTDTSKNKNVHKINRWMVERKGNVEFDFDTKFIGLIYFNFGNVPANIKTECIELGAYTCIMAESEVLAHHKDEAGIAHDKLCHKIFSIDLPFMIDFH